MSCAELSGRCVLMVAGEVIGEPIAKIAGFANVDRIPGTGPWCDEDVDARDRLEGSAQKIEL